MGRMAGPGSRQEEEAGAGEAADALLGVGGASMCSPYVHTMHIPGDAVWLGDAAQKTVFASSPLSLS